MRYLTVRARGRTAFDAAATSVVGARSNAFEGVVVHFTRIIPSAFFIVALAGPSLVASPALAGPPSSASGPVVSAAVHSDVSPPLRNLTPTSPSAATLFERPLRMLGPNGAAGGPDPVVQSTAGTAAATTSGRNFAGVGMGDYGFSVRYAPPDTNGVAGDTQYVQWVNTYLAVFDKSTGAIAAGFPKAGNAVWAGFGGGCETNNDGDPIVQYDKAAGRWILTQFSVSTLPYMQCLAVSTTSNATGPYNRYAFSYGNTQFNDYPKLGVWPDGYYITYNIFNNGLSFAGSKVCALDRTAMLAGTPATQQCFQLSTSYGGLLPSDLDGRTAPPSGSPNYVMNFGSNSLNLWRLHVDWTNSANTTLSAPVNIPVASFSTACNGSYCIPQPSTSQKLDSLGDRLMYRLAYRNFGDHEALVVNHSVKVGGNPFSAGISSVRWYELRNPTGTPIVYQQGTLGTADGIHRWMGSIAMDGAGDIALGYSASSGTVYPSIRYTGRVPTDTSGTMQAETIVKAGTGAQLQNLSRWGDYSAMTVDPTDDCTFWYTSEYLKTNGTWNWSTWITSFTFPSCTGAPAPLAVSTTSLPAGTVNHAYSANLTASGGTGTYSWSITTGTLPSGLSVNATTGAITGTPTTTGTSSFTATVNDGATTANRSLSITVNPDVTGLTITTTSLPGGTLGQPYAGATLAASGGSGGYTWSVVGGSFPTGLTPSTSGSISGTPSKVGNFTFTVQVRDSSASTATAVFTIKISQH
ncbi:MAG TPA: Ig domain-containing protein [Candidatus Limnocylindrales bacterium]|jgi:hypothetical protein